MSTIPNQCHSQTPISRGSQIKEDQSLKVRPEAKKVLLNNGIDFHILLRNEKEL